MAILKPFECKVEVDGVALEEYEDEDTEQANTTTSLTKYIEAISGTNFSVKLTVHPGWKMQADFIAWYINLDGKQSGGRVVKSEIYDGSRSCTSVLYGVASGTGSDWTERKFRFADITIGEMRDDLSPEELKRQYEGLGIISVKIWRMRLLEIKDHCEATRRDSLGIVPEKALKGQALSLSTDLGPSERIEPQKLWNGEKIERNPVATFQFKYRSRDALKQLLVIPRSPSPPPLEERDPEDLTPTEARELIRRQRAGLKELKSVKKEEEPSKKRNRASTIGPARPTKVARMPRGQSHLELDDSSDDVEIVKVEPASTRKSEPSANIEVIEILD